MINNVILKNIHLNKNRLLVHYKYERYGGGGGIEFRVLKMTILGFFGSLEKIAPSWVPVTNIFDSVLYSIVHIE